MKFYLAIILVIVAVAVADQDDDLWESYKVYIFKIQKIIPSVLFIIHLTLTLNN